MKRVILLLAVAALFSPLLANAVPDEVPGGDEFHYTNPIIAKALADPTVMRADDGFFYLFSTEGTRNMPVYRSADLVDWEFLGTAFTDETRPSFIKGVLWAPDINCINGKYVLYYTIGSWMGQATFSTWDVEWAGCGVGVAVADRIEGPYEDLGKIFTGDESDVQNTIDQYYYEEEDGSKWLFWGSYHGIYAIELSEDGLSVKEGAVKRRVAGSLTEGTIVYKRDGYYYMIGSTGDANTYRLVVARSKNLLGPYVDKNGLPALGNHFSELLHRSPEAIGPGHCSEMLVDDAGQTWLVHHAYKADNMNLRRIPHLSQVLWDSEGWPYVTGDMPPVSWDRPALPERAFTYEPVDYIEYNGGGWNLYDTGYVPVENTRVEVKCRSYAANAAGEEFAGQFRAVFCAGTDSEGLSLYVNRSGIDWSLYAAGYVNENVTAQECGREYTVSVDRHQMTVNGKTFKADDSAYSGTSRRLTMFSGFRARPYFGRIYYLKIYEGDTLVHDFRPCRRVEDGMPVFCDLVEHVAVRPFSPEGFLCGMDAPGESEDSSLHLAVDVILPVTGEKIDHQGIVINPTPHSLVLEEGFLDVSAGLVVEDGSGIFAGTEGLNASDGVKVSLEFGSDAAAKESVEPVSGAYKLIVGTEGISLAAYDERGAFYGIQTLRQLLSSPAAESGKLPCLRIDDYPDLPNRGVVEGFYGTPWSHETRLSLIDFFGKFKANVYLYGPKDDTYHSLPNWRLPYPEAEAQNIRELVQACRRNYVDFVWAVHPGQDIRWDDEDYHNLLNKFESMYDLGVRSFGIYFDDITGDGADPMKQAALLNRLTEEFVRVKGDVSPLILCPTDYSKRWANPSPQGALAVYGRELDPSVNIFWTGDEVCSDLTPESIEFVDGRIRRPAYYWWNFPVTDYAREIVMQGPAYGLDNSIARNELNGMVCNPMEYGEASKLAVYSVADYAWNVAAYNAVDSWERGLEELMPGAVSAYRSFAVHSCDTGVGYRRDESWETPLCGLADLTEERAAALVEEFTRIEAVPAEIEAGCDNTALLDELRPWLVEFGKLGTRCRKAVELACGLSDVGDPAAFWVEYSENLMGEEDMESYNAHKSGTLRLQPFYESLMNEIKAAFVESHPDFIPSRNE